MKAGGGVSRMASFVYIPVYGERNGQRSVVVARAKVSQLDSYLRRYKWRRTSQSSRGTRVEEGYVYRQSWRTVRGIYKRVNLYLHREILDLEPGNPLEGHHKDDDPLNCCRGNLERLTRKENEARKETRLRQRMAKW
jgi:hypothetical protein